MNTTIIIGNLGSDPEMSYTPSGKATTKFSVAVSRKYNDSDGVRMENTTWFRVTAWDKLAETANEFLKKGHKVGVTGRVSMAEWDGPDGGHRSALEINASQLEFLTPRPSGDYNADKPVEEPVGSEPVADMPF